MPRNQTATRKQIIYRRGYKYQLSEPYAMKLPFKPPVDIVTEWIELGRNGVLVIHQGYAWDGASGPARDTKTIMRGSLVHDALYQLMREGILPQKYRELADKILYLICKQDGMWQPRAWYVHRAVKRCAAPFARPESLRPAEVAP